MRENPRFSLDGRRMCELKKLRSVLLVAFIGTVLATGPTPHFLPGAPGVFNSFSSSQQTADPNAAVNQVVVNTTVTPIFTLLDFSGLSPVSVLVSMGQHLPANSSATTMSITTTFKPLSITAQFVIRNTTGTFLVSLQPSSVAVFAATSRIFSITLPSNTTSATIAFQGDQSGESILGRYATVLPSVSVQGSPVFLPYSDRTTCSLPKDL